MDHSQADIAELVSSFPKSKTNKDLSIVVRYLFENPKNMGAKLLKLGTPQQYKTGHNLDINILFKLYDNINKLKLTESVSQSLKASLESLENKEKLQDFLKNNSNIRFFFIIMLWDQLYLTQKNTLNLLKFLNLVDHIGPLKKNYLQWCGDIPAQFMKLQVQQLKKLLGVQLQKMKPGMVSPNLFHIVQLNVHNILQFLKLLYSSNIQKPRLQNDHFTYQKIAEQLKPLDVFKLSLRKQKKIDFFQYPFIFQLDYKYRLLQIQSIYQQKVNMQKNMETGIYNLMNGNIQLNANGGFSLQGLVYLHFQINRNNILNDSMEKLCKIKHNLKNPLRIKFIGEEGADQGGVQNQYFQLLTKEIFNPYLDMFLAKNNGRVYWFNGFSYEPPIRFEFVGMLLGLAIYNSVHLDIHFPRMLYKKLLSKKDLQPDVHELLSQLQQLQPEFYRSMKQILQSKEPLNELELYFNIELQNFGQKIVQQLVEDGSQIPLNQDNKEEYVYMYCQHLLNKHCEKQFKAFKKGFDRVVDTQLIEMFTPEELQTIICGKQVIDFHDLQANAHYEGYTADTPIVKNLWKVLHKLSQQQKKAFLMFCTGSDRVPLAGLKSLNFVVQKHANSNHFPTAHTCFNVLLLPQYETIEKLQKNIDFILKNNQGFGLI